MDMVTIFKMEFSTANNPIYIFLTFPLNFYNNPKVYFRNLPGTQKVKHGIFTLQNTIQSLKGIR